MKLMRWAALLPILFLTACLDVTITQVAPVADMVVSPTQDEADVFPTVTPSPEIEPTLPATEVPATIEPIAATTTIGSPADVSPLWEAEEVRNPVAVGGVIERLGVLTDGGEFVWVDGRSGNVLVRTRLWEEPTPGATTGQMYVEGSLAIVALRERTADAETGLATQRAKLVVVDGDGNIVWALEELTDGRSYTLSTSSGTLLIATTPRGFEDNLIGGYELFTGGRLWRTDDTNLPNEGQTPTPPPTEQPPRSGYPRLTAASGLGFALIDNGTGGGVMAFSPNNGDVLWVRQNRSEAPLRHLVVHDLRVYALSEQTVLILDGETGDILLRSAFAADVEAGIAPFIELAAVAPAPTDTLTRPGIVGFDVNGDIRWHSVIGLRALSIAAGDMSVWATVADFDDGTVSLSLLDAADGLELRRLQVSENLDAPFTVTVEGRRVYVLGDVLYAFGY